MMCMWGVYGVSSVVMCVYVVMYVVSSVVM